MKYFTFLVGSLIFGTSYSQTTQAHFLNANNIQAFVSDAGSFFEQFNSSSPGFEVPSGLGNHVLYSMGFWIAGIDENGQIQGAAQNYANSRDWYPGTMNGPLPGTGNSIIAKISRLEVDDFLTDYNDDGVLQGNHDAVFDWPAHGDVSLGEDFYLAPFNDVDLDGVYDPTQGDYPCFKGSEAVYLILNDVGGIHESSGMNAAGIELRCMFYAYADTTANNNAIFVDVNVIKQGTSSLNEVYFGIYADSDIGLGSDDFFGCDSTTNTMYFYNGDAYDEGQIGGSGYQDETPALGIRSLQSPASSILYYSNGGTIDYSDPSTALGFYNNLKGLNIAGQPWAEYGDTTKFAYSSTDIDVENSMISENQPSRDFRGIMSIDIGSLNYQDRFTETFVFTYSNANDTLSNSSSVYALLADLDINELRYNSDIDQCSGVTNLDEKELEVSIFPNPTNDNVTIELLGEFEYVLYSLQGELLLNSRANSFEVLSLSELNAGTYFLKLSQGGKISTQKIIKQ